MTHQMQIGDRKIGGKAKPYVIAELSGNHNNDLDRAIALVDAAAKAGADAVKLQTYTADTMTLDVDKEEFYIRGGLWDGYSLYELYQEASTPWEWHKPIFDRCRAHGIHGFSSAFDETAVDFLETLDVPAYKIASLELGDTELVRKVASTGKPVIMSTGMASLAEIDTSVQEARAAGAKEIALLRCTSAYPAPAADANLRTIPLLAQAFACCSGLSDHTMGTHIPVAAVALGASIIEKHFTLKRSDGGVDSDFSLEPEELRQLCSDVADAHEAIGHAHFGGHDSERNAQLHRRSLYITEDMKAGDVLTTKNLRSIRPGHGLEIEHRERLIGLQVTQDVRRGTAMSWELVGREA